VLRLRRALLKRLQDRPALQVIEADLLHLLTSWFNPGLLQMKRVDWNSPAQLLEKIIHHEAMHKDDVAALQLLCSAYLLGLSPTPAGDPVARFHLDNGARLERLSPKGNLSGKGLRQSFGLMVNYLYDLSEVEASHAKFRQGEVARSRAVSAPP